MTPIANGSYLVFASESVASDEIARMLCDANSTGHKLVPRLDPLQVAPRRCLDFWWKCRPENLAVVPAVAQGSAKGNFEQKIWELQCLVSYSVLYLVWSMD